MLNYKLNINTNKYEKINNNIIFDDIIGKNNNIIGKNNNIKINYLYIIFILCIFIFIYFLIIEYNNNNNNNIYNLYRLLKHKILFQMLK